MPNDSLNGSDINATLAVLRRRKVLVAVVTCLVVLLALGLTLRQTPMYEATAKVLVRPGASPDGLSAAAVVDTSTESEVVNSQPVAEDAARRLGVSPENVRQGLSVAPVSDSAVLLLKYRAPSATLAQRAVNAFADSYIEYQAGESAQQVQQSLGNLRKSIASVTQDLRKADRRPRSVTEQDELAARKNALTARLAVLQQRLDDVTSTARNTQTRSQILQNAERPSSPASPNYVVNLLLALFMGGALGIALAFLRERLDDRFDGLPDIERTLEAPVLGLIPQYEVGNGSASSIAVMDTDSNQAGEAYRSLRANLQFITMGSEIKSILVTSAASGEGKTRTVANVGTALAIAGRRTVLVSADLRRPALEQIFDINSPERGLSSFLIDKTQHPSEILVKTEIENLWLVPSGRVPPNPTELLSSPRLQELVQFLESNYDIVLFDSPPVLPVADALIIGSQLGGSLMVVDASRSHRSATVRTKSELVRSGGRFIGSTLNRTDAGEARYQAYGY